MSSARQGDNALMERLLVLGGEALRARVAEQLETVPGLAVDECDPSLGDCVMYVRLEGARYDAFLFLDFGDRVTRGALSSVAERAVLVPLLDGGGAEPDPVYDGYLFRLPRALGFRTDDERLLAHERMPEAAGVPSEVVGGDVEDTAALARLLSHVRRGRWEWADLVERVAAEIRSGGPAPS